MPDRASLPSMLVVDDEEGPRESFKIIFESDFKVVLAESGPAGLAAASQTTFDVAIVDLNMADMGGIEVIQRLKKLSPSTEILMVTGFESLSSVHEALRSGACDYLSKPFSVATMRAAVARAAQRGALLKQLSDHASQTDFLRGELIRKATEAHSNKAESEVYACILHDIRNPLCIIESLVTLIEEETQRWTFLPSDKVEGLRRHVHQIHKEVRRCSEVSDRYLKLLRTENRSLGTVDLNALLGDLKKLLSLMPSAKNNKVEIHPLPEECSVRINSTDLLQMLVNITSNALECASQPHQVRITATAWAAALDVSALRRGDGQLFAQGTQFNNQPPMVCISIEDNGPGIASNSLSSIFEPFITSKLNPNGVGLGLAIVNRLLHQSSAALHVRSNPGLGSSFSLFVPVHPSLHSAA